MNHLITAQFELTTPSDSWVEGMDLAKEKATEMLVEMSRELGLPIKLVRVDPMPRFEGVNTNGLHPIFGDVIKNHFSPLK